MFTKFTLLSGTTVPSNYSWDYGTPLTGSNLFSLNAITTSNYVSGYAPGVRVVFKNDSVPNSDFSNVGFTWDFGDYYNNATNIISLSCLKSIEHTFIMPGRYTVTLTQRQSKIRQDFNYVQNSDYCLSKYNFRWFWDNMVSVSGDTLTWDETRCFAKYSKWWDDEVECFGKHCKFWNWLDLRSTETEGVTPVTWEQTYTGKEFEKRWARESNSTVCAPGKEVTFLDTLITDEQTYTITNVVEVLEIKPEAFLYTFTTPITGVTPFSVHLSPRFTKPGSFAIERIDWDFGDGTPVQTVWRHQPPTQTMFTYTSTFSADVKDPRNYDAHYTYKRTLNTYPIFYPSITAYSGSTNSFDSCSLVIGPISLSSISPKVHILKSKALGKNNFYAFQIDKNTSFAVTQSSENFESLNFVPTTPSNLIKAVITPVITYRGNTGSGYPPNYNPEC